MAIASSARTGRTRIVAAAFLVAATTVVAPMPQTQAATTVRVRTIVATTVSYGDVVGATISLIQTCPTGASLDVRQTRQRTPRTPSNFRLLSREFWPRGLVSRWRMTAPMPQRDNAPSPGQTVVCLENLDLGTARHTARVSVISRLWGPTPFKAWLDSSDTTSSTWSGMPAPSSVRITRVAGKRMIAFADSEEPNLVFAYGGVGVPGYPAGEYSELRLGLAITSRHP